MAARKRSLFATLGSVIVLTIVIIMGVHAAITYKVTEGKMIDEIKARAQQSIVSLQRNISGLMEAYAVNEYENLVTTEMERRDSFAIVVKDYRMGNILGQEAYVSGKIRDLSGNIVDYDPEDGAQKRQLEECFYSQSAAVSTPAGETIGSVTIYISDGALIREERRIVFDTMIDAAAISLLLILTLFVILRLFILKPLLEVVAAIGDSDEDGIPIAPIPTSDTREIAALAETMNRMLEAIRDSREALKGSEFRWKFAVEGSGDGLWDWNLVTDEVYFSPQWKKMLGFEADEIAGSLEEWSKRVHPGDLEAVYADIERHLSGKAPVYLNEHRVLCKDGSYKWILDRGIVVERDGSGKPVRMIGTHTDISEQVEGRKKLEESEARLTAMLDVSPIAVRIIETGTNRVVYANRAYVRLVKSEYLDVVGIDPGYYYARSEEYEEVVSRIKNGETLYNSEVELSIKGKHVWALASYMPIEYEGKSSILGWFYDITSQKESELKLEYAAYHDVLTDLPNRLQLSLMMPKVLARTRRHGTLAALLFMDLDGFKEVNDRYGHEAGDRLLKDVAERILHVVREDDIVVRLGGDEFAVLVSDIHYRSEAAPLIERMLGDIAQPYAYQGHTLSVSVSIGVSFYPQELPIDPETLLRQADQAMYSAKHGGKNRYVCYDESADATQRVELAEVQHIKEALERREFVVKYQPKVEMRSGEVIGAEALIRWNDPERGMLYPGHFLPMIENHSLIYDLDLWVLEEACAQLTEWNQKGFRTTVSVNISAYSFKQEDFIASLEAIIEAQQDVNPEQLEIELLESSALHDIDEVQQVIETLHEHGISVALDDFGTGYSTLSYLKKLDIDYLKVDKGFVMDMLHDPADLSILDATLGLAEAFRADVIAEGVESEAHGNLLIAFGCRFAQGYTIGRAMEPEAFMEWKAAWKPYESWKTAHTVPTHLLPIIYASVEHRKWFLQLERYMDTGDPARPETDTSKCRFGKWLHEEGHTFFETDEEYAAVDALHERFHASAIALIGAEGDELEALWQATVAAHHELMHRLEEKVKVHMA